jgi:hypothetical protein
MDGRSAACDRRDWRVWNESEMEDVSMVDGVCLPLPISHHTPPGHAHSSTSRSLSLPHGHPARPVHRRTRQCDSDKERPVVCIGTQGQHRPQRPLCWIRLGQPVLPRAAVGEVVHVSSRLARERHENMYSTKHEAC